MTNNEGLRDNAFFVVLGCKRLRVVNEVEEVFQPLDNVVRVFGWSLTLIEVVPEELAGCLRCLRSLRVPSPTSR